MRMSDLVAQTILEMLDSQNGNAEIQRNELATTLGCVPSQINYVITSRFTPEQGYVVESRRGGGGYIRIRRIKTDDKTMLMHVV
ncbi:MAG: CtsR family transcriptional regulator, partial [Ruminococcus sp.]